MGTTNEHLKEAIDRQKKSWALNRYLGLFQVLQKRVPAYLCVLSRVLNSAESSVVATESTPDDTEVVAIESQTPRNKLTP